MNQKIYLKKFMYVNLISYFYLFSLDVVPKKVLHEEKWKKNRSTVLLTTDYLLVMKKKTLLVWK